MYLQLDAGLQNRIAGTTFGMVTINGVSVRERDERVWRQVAALALRQGRAFTLAGLSEYEQIAAVRGLQKSFGYDPTRYRPSSEALLRRVLKGQGLPQINSAVDVNNFCSLEFLLPMCIYDLRHVRGSVRVRIGEPGESYQGIGRQVFQAEHKVVIADDDGIMGSTVFDSERTKVTTTTTDILLAIYAPAHQDPQTIQAYAALAGKRMVECSGGCASDVLALTV
jgi:DNA/RNA-binding domain of Phe-tRNA-synthetase-like protein